MPAQIQHRRPAILKTWHIATLAPGVGAGRLEFPLRVITNDSSDKIFVFSQEELDTLVAKYRDDESQKSIGLASSPQRSDSVVGSLKLNPQPYYTDMDAHLGITSSSCSSAASVSCETLASDEYDDTPLSEHFVNGEIVCTSGLVLEAGDLTQMESEAGDVVFSCGRSLSIAVRRRYRKTTRMEKVKKFVSSVFKILGGLRYSA